MIYNEWFRDENLEAPLMLGYKKTDDAGNDATPGNDTKDHYLNRPDLTTNTNEARLYSRFPAKAENSTTTSHPVCHRR